MAAENSVLRSAVLLVVLALIWLICSGFLKPFFLISGAICCLLVLVIVQRMNVVDAEGQPVALTMRSPLYFLWLLKEMVVASWRVARLSLKQHVDISPTFENIVSKHDGDVAHTIYANSITMTPGTVTVSVMKDKKKTEFLVHALEKESIDDLKEGCMSRRVSSFVTGEDKK